jgi:TonB family protein
MSSGVYFGTSVDKAQSIPPAWLAMKSKAFLIVGLSMILAGFAYAQESGGQEIIHIRLSQDIANELLIHRVEPAYPEEARIKGITGTVIVYVVIARDGSATRVAVMRGDPLFRDAAVDAVKQWKYRPYVLNGEPIPVETSVTLHFGPKETPTSIKLRVSDFECNPLHKVNPEYPPEAKAKRIQGDVILKVTIDPEGNVTGPTPVTGDPLLVEAAVKAVQQWKCKPYLLNGKPVAVETTIKIMFHM